jgi:hypothetical protein
MKTLYFRTLLVLLLVFAGCFLRADIAALVAERNTLKSSIWSQEVEAQDHEEAFIRLWDSLRNSEDSVLVLSTFEFGELKLGNPGEWVVLDHDIHVNKLGPASKILTKEQWVQWITQMAANGFELMQSEWHHKQFEKRVSGAARSVVSATLHVENKKLNTRFILDGKLNITWQANRNSKGYYSPKTIEIGEMEILYRTGAPLFQRLGVIDIAPKKRGPVLMYDLDEDGRSEIVLPATNQIAWNDGKGGYRMEPYTNANIVSVRASEFPQCLIVLWVPS